MRKLSLQLLNARLILIAGSATEKTAKYSSEVHRINLAEESGICRGSAFIKFSSSISFLLFLIHGWEELVSAIALMMG